jgi:hypothetical protein
MKGAPAMRTLAAIVASSLAVAACGGRDDSSSTTTDVGSTMDASASDAIAASDAGAPHAADSGAPNDAPAADPLAPCAGSRDVFYMKIEGTPGSFEPGEWTFTNLGSRWMTTASSPSLGVEVDDSIRSASFEVYLMNDLLPAVGAHDTSGVNVAMNGELCLPDSGSYTIAELQTDTSDAGVRVLTSLLLSFDLSCPSSGGAPERMHGCIRYAAQ